MEENVTAIELGSSENIDLEKDRNNISVNKAQDIFFKDAILVFLKFILFQLVLVGILIFFIKILNIIKFKDISELLNNFRFKSYTTLFTTYPAIFFATWHSLKKKFPDTNFFESLKIKTLNKNQYIYLGIIALILFFIKSYILDMYLDSPNKDITVSELFDENSKLTGVLAYFPYLSFHISILVAPFFEEIFFRGFLYKSLKNSFGSFISITVVTISFCLMHDDGRGLLPLVIVGTSGLIFGLLRHFYKSLTPSIYMHFLTNLFIMLNLYIQIIIEKYKIF